MKKITFKTGDILVTSKEKAFWPEAGACTTVNSVFSLPAGNVVMMISDAQRIVYDDDAFAPALEARVLTSNGTAWMTLDNTSVVDFE